MFTAVPQRSLFYRAGHIAASLEKRFASFRRNILPSSSGVQGSRELAFISKLVRNIYKAQGTEGGKWPASYQDHFTPEEFSASTEQKTGGCGWRTELIWTLWRKKNSDPYRESNYNCSVIHLIEALLGEEFGVSVDTAPRIFTVVRKEQRAISFTFRPLQIPAKETPHSVSIRQRREYFFSCCSSDYTALNAVVNMDWKLNGVLEMVQGQSVSRLWVF